MILLTRLNGSKFYLNAEMIQSVDITPDTVITLVDKNKYVVQEPADVVVQLFIEYKKKTHSVDWFDGGDARHTGS